MIDLEKELKFMAQEYGFSEKQVLNWWRTAVRQMWSNSPFKRKLEEEAKFLVVNDNPRSMKKYPEVARIKCVKCQQDFSPSDMNLDHIIGENSATDLSHAESFMKSILFTPRSNLQWMCDDLQKTRNKKKVTVSIGCHSIKSQIEKNPSLSENEAWVIRELGRIERYESFEEVLLAKGIKPLPKTKKAQKELLQSILLKEKEGE